MIDIEKNGPDGKQSTLKQSQSQTKETTFNTDTGFHDAFLVTFSPDDPENPLNWSNKLKWGITAAVSGTGFVRIMRMTSQHGGAQIPELRIPLLLPGALLTPVGFLLYGWAAQYRLLWLVVDIGAALLVCGMQVFDTILTAYVMDAYPQHVSSAVAATQVLRSLLAFAFPLFSHSLYGALGYGWGNSLLAFLSVGIAVPFTGILGHFGARLRARQLSSY